MVRGLLAIAAPRLELRTLTPIAASIAMAAVVYFLRNMDLAGCIGFGVLTYSVFLLVFKGVTPDDVGIARNG